jgi:hypothetical protein
MRTRYRFSLPEGALTTYDSYPERTLPDGRVRIHHFNMLLKISPLTALCSHSVGGLPSGLHGPMPFTQAPTILCRRWSVCTVRSSSGSTILSLLVAYGETFSWDRALSAASTWSGCETSSIPRSRICGRRSRLGNSQLGPRVRYVSPRRSLH